MSLVTLGVANVPAAREFDEALEWTRAAGDDDVVTFQTGCMVSPCGVVTSSPPTAA